MKEKLDEKSKEALVRYRLNRAEEAVSEAELLSKGSYHNAAINRLYYGGYYATSALLLSNDISMSTHDGVKTMLGLHFVSTCLFQYEHGHTLSSRLFEIRHSDEYDFVYCDKAVIGEYIPKTKSFIETVKTVLNS
jgi:uncharacterized protein (UPF0332 family)